LQLVVSVTGLWTHAPPLHESTVQSLPSSQLVHAAPAKPHAALVLPATHEVPL
jgi:hypothetical protein